MFRNKKPTQTTIPNPINVPTSTDHDNICNSQNFQPMKDQDSIIISTGSKILIEAYMAIIILLMIPISFNLVLKSLAFKSTFLNINIKNEYQNAIVEMADNMLPISELSQFLISPIILLMFIMINRILKYKHNK